MKFVLEMLRGMVIGLANIIPGVSGGTMMVSMGIYDTLIHCITHLFKEFKKSILTLLPYAVGMVLAQLARKGKAHIGDVRAGARANEAVHIDAHQVRGLKAIGSFLQHFACTGLQWSLGRIQVTGWQIQA